MLLQPLPAEGADLSPFKYLKITDFIGCLQS